MYLVISQRKLPQLHGRNYGDRIVDGATRMTLAAAKMIRDDVIRCAQ